ncbi:anti-phage ZorAB system protein ZorA [Alloalcanivorax xenomutans]|uniref:anti-phage ZorAB system protein ZorA n=1 Tax=Alloalcanivorax xenomutans TaxID=1094342 RepID=UPI00292CD4E7|nr:anti-phage ZorAB system protein ZorA [Alloalcanivorax xenomutans]WOA30212.1 anti-phage ZorAB system protein ZorA [Alloalcanivorax xenomutans]
MKALDILSLLTDMNELSWFFVGFMLFIFIITCVSLFAHWLNYQARSAGVRALVKDQSRENLARNRRQTLEIALEKKKDVGNLWREFDESLVFSKDKEKLFNTLDAEHFFNTRTLASGLTESRLLAAAPSFMVAIGVLGTFVGLSLGLADLHLGNDLDQLRGDMERMISGAATAFNTSIFGVLLSLVLNLGEKLLERRVRKQIRFLQQDIDFLYPRIPAEQTLVHIEDATTSSAQSMMELHERIGDRLQETVSAMSESMQEAISDSLRNVMAPALERLAKNASDQSTTVLEQLVGSFLDKFGEAGRQQGQALERVAGDVGGAVEGIRSEIGRVSSMLSEAGEKTEGLLEQQRQQTAEQIARIKEEADAREQSQRQQFEKLLEGVTRKLTEQAEVATRADQERQARLDSAITNMQQGQAESLNAFKESSERSIQASERLLETMEPIARHLGEAAGSLDRSAENLRNTEKGFSVLGAELHNSADRLGNTVTSMVERLATVSDTSAKVAEAIRGQIGQLEQLQDTLVETSKHMEGAAARVLDGFGSMETSQNRYLESVKQQFEALGETLKQQVMAVEKQAEQWLATYHKEVTGQIQDRMGKWDEISRQYADGMLNTVNAIQGVVDELESKAR